MADYIGELIGRLKTSYGLPSTVRLVTDIQPVVLDAKSAVHCGLLVTELFSNTLKHAFPAGREGEILIALKEESSRITLSVSDNGVGVADGIDPVKSASMGLLIVRSIISQMGASLSSPQGKPGTSWHISWSSPPRRRISGWSFLRGKSVGRLKGGYG